MGRQGVVRLRAAEDDVVGHPARGREVAHPRQFGAEFGAVRSLAQFAPGDDQGGRRAFPALAQRGEPVDQERDPFDRVDAADEEHDRLGAEPQLRAGGGAVAGPEEVEVDAAADGVDLGGAHAVPPADLRPFAGVGRHDRVDLAHDPALGLDAPLGLPAVGGADRRRGALLQPAEGVEHLHRRGAPIAAQQVRDPAGEPVVAVDDVVTDAVAQGEEGHFGGEAGQVVEEGVLVERGGRAGADVDHPHPVAEGHDVGRVRVGPARK